jgi:hypothetical protein
MLNLRNANLDTPISLAVDQNRLEIFIYLLHSFETFYRDKGLDCINIEGNSLLHLAAKNTEGLMGIYFSKVLMNFDPVDSHSFQRMVNQKNN